MQKLEAGRKKKEVTLYWMPSVDHVLVAQLLEACHFPEFRAEDLKLNRSLGFLLC